MAEVFGGLDRRFTSTEEVLDTEKMKAIDKNKPFVTGTNIHKWKTIDFWLGSANGKDSYKNRTNWRRINLGGINFDSDKTAVKESVVLLPEQTEFKVASEIKWENEETGTSKGGGFLDVLKTASEVFSGSTARPEWVARSFSDLNELGLNGEFTFKFASSTVY